jgi:hypothetical protein
LRVGVQRGVRVGVDERWESRGVDVIGVLVGDQDGGQAGDSLEAVGEGTGIKEHAGLIELGK